MAVTWKRYMEVPCGKCIECLSRRRRDWSFRLEQELKNSESAQFITLTYNEVALPENSQGEPTLVKSDLQAFLKRLRINIDRGYLTTKLDGKQAKIAAKKNNIRYYAVGEYGSLTNRPHYHLIIFNLTYDYELIKKCWTLGDIYFGTVTMASIQYVTKYLMKSDKDYINVQKPFSLMSRKSGLGSSYLIENGDFHSDNDIFEVQSIELGRMVIPRFYKDKLFNEQQKLTNRIENERAAANRDSQFIADCQRLHLDSFRQKDAQNFRKQRTQTAKVKFNDFL